MSDQRREHRPTLDTGGFTDEQRARVVEFMGQQDRFARINELHLAWLAINDHPMRYTPEVQLYILGRMAMLAFGSEPDGGGDEPA